jgi:DNA polymerase-3 subunit delta'
MFREIIGQSEAIAALQHALVNDRIPGTYLFTGPEHIGKTMAAVSLAQAINCTSHDPRQNPDGCGECYSCRAIASGSHPDVRSAAPSGLSHILRIPQFWPREGVKEHPADRAMLRDLSFGPARARRRIFIIEDADALNDDAANSLLKVLEEPPSYAHFILTASSESAVLPTISSRSQSVRFSRAGSAEIEKALIETRNIPLVQARFASSLAEGRMGTAVEMATDAALLETRDKIIETAAQITAGNPNIIAFKIADELKSEAQKLSGSKKSDAAEGQRIALARTLDIVTLWFADLIRVAASGDQAQIASIDKSELLAQHASQHSAYALAQSARILLDTRRAIERNANAQIALESCAMKLVTQLSIK